jgi:carbamoyl-phosphate synthase large subunit
MQNITTKFRSILVSGAAGDIGIGIGRILKSENFHHVYGCDVNDDSWGVCVFDKTIKIPRADACNYFDELIALINTLEVDLFIPSSEAEIKVLINYKEDLENFLGCKVLIADSFTVNIALDKLSTANFLKNNDLDSPWTLKAVNELPLSLPCMFKPVSGQGSKGIEIIKDIVRAKELLDNPDYIFQEYLDPDEQEYTCGVFRSKKGELRTIHINRTLSGGFTGKGTIVENDEIDAYVSQIAETLEVKGAINMQLRLTSQGPILFEINPRLSSTVVFRHKLGFEDLIWAIEDLANLPIRQYNKPKAGTQFYRGLSEYFKN